MVNSVCLAMMGMLAAVKCLAPYSTLCRLAFCTLGEEPLLGTTKEADPSSVLTASNKIVSVVSAFDWTRLNERLFFDDGKSPFLTTKRDEKHIL